MRSSVERRVKPLDRSAIIYRALRHAIIEQALSPGSKLSEDAIGEQFGARRTVVRYALGQLAAEGLVELKRNHGASVALSKLLRQIADFGIAVILVEHDMLLVMGISDQIAVLDAGRVIAQASPQEIRRDPKVLKAASSLRSR
jgi:DNA-binding transcriptional MocR family regulator